MAPHGLHHGVAVRPGGKSWAHTDDHRGIGDPGSQIALGKNGIHHSIRGKLGDTEPFRIRQHRQKTGIQQFQRLGGSVCPLGGDIFDGIAALRNGRAEGYGAADGQGTGQVGHDHPDPAVVQPQGNPAGQISGTPNDYKHEKTPLCRLPAITG